MNLDDLEKNLHIHSVDQGKTIEALICMTVQNNTILSILLENQSKINFILDPSKTKEEYHEDLLNRVKQNGNEMYTTVINQISNT